MLTFSPYLRKVLCGIKTKQKKRKQQQKQANNMDLAVGEAVILADGYWVSLSGETARKCREKKAAVCQNKMMSDTEEKETGKCRRL